MYGSQSTYAWLPLACGYCRFTSGASDHRAPREKLSQGFSRGDRLEPPDVKQLYPQARLPYIFLLFSGFSNVNHSTCVWPTTLKLGCYSLFLAMGFISVVDKIQFMLISRHYICIRSVHCVFTSLVRAGADLLFPVQAMTSTNQKRGQWLYVVKVICIIHG